MLKWLFQSVLLEESQYAEKWILTLNLLVAQSCLTLWNPMDCSLTGSSVHGLFQARILEWVQFSSVAQLCPTLCDPMDSSTPGLPVHHQLPEFTQTHVHWVGDAIQPISSSVVPFSRLQSFPASGSFPMSQFFTSGGQSIGVSASAPALPLNIQDWFPLGWTGWISLQSKGLARVFSNTAIQKHRLEAS